MVRFLLGEKSDQLYSGLCTSSCFVCYDNAYFYALLQDHYLIRLTESALFSATPRPRYWSRQQTWCQRHGLGPESHQQCRRAGQYQTHPEVFANIFPGCSFITKQNSCWCCVGLEENRQKRPHKSNWNYYLNKSPRGCDLNSHLLVFLLPTLRIPNISLSLLISWESGDFSHCNTGPITDGCFFQPCLLCTHQYLHFQWQVLCSSLCLAFCSPFTVDHTCTV